MQKKDLKEGFLYKDYSKRGHCKNGTFKVKIKDGVVLVADTYWTRPVYVNATEEYIKDFEEVLKLEDYNIFNGHCSVSEYSEDCYIQVHYNQCSGRFSDSTDYFLKKGSKKSIEIATVKLEKHIENLERKLSTSKDYLKRLTDGEITPEQVHIF